LRGADVAPGRVSALFSTRHASRWPP